MNQNKAEKKWDQGFLQVIRCKLESKELKLLFQHWFSQLNGKQKQQVKTKHDVWSRLLVRTDTLTF